MRIFFAGSTQWKTFHSSLFFLCAITHIFLLVASNGKHSIGQEIGLTPAEPNGKLSTIHSPQTEVVAANEFIVVANPESRPYIRFFSIYNIPKEDTVTIPSDDITRTDTVKVKDGIIKTLNFWIHSISYESVIQPVHKVPGDNDLWWIDIRDYGWTPEAWEKVSKNEPYFREPWISYKDYELLRLLAGNAIVRADWFILHTSDVTKQTDRDEMPLYYELLYSKTGVPKTLEEFRAAWGIDVKKIEELAIEKGVIVDKGSSGISRNNRQISRTRTELGYYYETSDTKTSEGAQDYVENLDPIGLSRNDRDAGESFTTNKLGLQVYFLYDGKNKRVEFGDPTVVWDKTDTKDIRVRTARSCIVCHGNAINIPQNALSDHLKSGVELLTYRKEYQIAVERFYLSPMGKLFIADQEIYAAAVQAVNGLSSDANSKLYKEILNWYERSLSIQHAAQECGVSVEEFKDKCSATTSGRLASLVKSEKTINRESWEDLQGGTFAQAMLLIHRITQEQIQEQIQKIKPKNPLEIRILKDLVITQNRKTIASLRTGDIIILDDEQPRKDGLYTFTAGGSSITISRQSFEWTNKQE